MKRILIYMLLFSVLSACTKEESKGSGSAVFYTTSTARGNITITISTKSRDPLTFKLPVTTNPDTYCTSGYTGYVLLDVGTYSYKAVAADGTQWNGTIDIQKGICLKRSIN